MLNISITALYAGLLALMLVAHIFNIIRLRYKYRVGLGDGGQTELQKAIRIHGNFAEHVPFALILMAAFELSGGAALWLHICGALLVLGRISHATGLLKTVGTSIYRQFGMISMFIVLLGLGIANIIRFFYVQGWAVS